MLWPMRSVNDSPARDISTPFIAVIPALNEDRSIGAVLDELLAAKPECIAIVVDDGSVDDTACVAREHGARVVRMPRNVGIGSAVQVGFRIAEREGIDCLVQIDADGQHDPAHLDAILDPVRRGEVNVASGSRYLDGGSFQHALHRHLLIRAFANLITLVTGQTFTDTSSSFRAYDRQAIVFCADHYPQGFLETVESLVTIKRAGLTVREVPVVIRQRDAGTSSLSLGRTIVYTGKVVLAIAASLTRHKVAAPQDSNR